MINVIVFDMSDEDDKTKYKLCEKAEDMALFIYDMKHTLTHAKKIKATAKDIEENILDLLKAHNIAEKEV